MIKYVVASLMLGVIITLSLQLNACRANNTKLQGDISICNANKTTCDNMLLDQNRKIEAQRIDYEKRLSDYRKAHPKVIHVPLDVNLTRSNCEDIAGVIDAIRISDF